MIALTLTFPARRYHATPWGHHVNEGLVEWPPSPWRLLRALLSVGYTALGWRQVPQTARALILRLCDVLPTYRVPAAIATHSRHYMPVGEFRDDGLEETTLVFDAWARIEHGALCVIWDVDLPREERDLLAELARCLGYLGRAESWVEARVLGDDEPLPRGREVVACDRRGRPGASWEQVVLMAPEPAAAFAAWRAERLVTAAPEGAVRGSKRRVAGPRLPEDLIECLESRTAQLREDGWSQPPGTRRALYWRPADALEVGQPAPQLRAPTIQPVALALLVLAPASGNLHTLPQVHRALPHGERIHRALVKFASGGAHSAILTGRSPQGRPLEGHQHAHVLPVDLDDDGHLDHVLLWAPAGFDGEAQEAIRAIRRTYAKGVSSLLVAVAGMGDRRDLLAVQEPWRRALTRVLGPVDGAREWVSATPFVAPRFLKERGRNTLTAQVQAELASRGLPSPVDVDCLDAKDPNVLREAPWLGRFRHYVLARSGGGSRPPQQLALALRLRFDHAVRGPLCLGYGSHFGLGRFAAID